MRTHQYAPLENRWQAGTASDFVQPLAVNPDDNVVLCCRVSHHTQQRQQNLADQETNLRQVVESRGGNVVGVFSHVGSGCDPSWLVLAARTAREHNAIILSESTDRLIRSPYYHSKRFPDAQARTFDLEDLAYWTAGVTLMTVLHPDALPAEVRSYQRKRGQQVKGHKGGRGNRNDAPGYLKRRREALLPEVLQLHQDGLSLGQIARQTGLPRATVQKWLARYR